MTGTFTPEHHHRRSIRLEGYDYTLTGAYFVTLVAQDRTCLFGEAAGVDVRLNEAGGMAAHVWNSLSARFPDVELDAFVVMPNHIHGVIVLNGHPGLAPDTASANTASYVPTTSPARRAPTRGAPTGSGTQTILNARPDKPARLPGDREMPAAPTSLGAIVGAYKSLVTVEYVRGVKTRGWPPFPGRLWHRNYFEHIIRNEASLNRIRKYIAENPARWAEDDENPLRQSCPAGDGAFNGDCASPAV